MDKVLKSSQVRGEHHELPQEGSWTQVLSEPPATGFSDAATGKMSVIEKGAEGNLEMSSSIVNFVQNYRKCTRGRVQTLGTCINHSIRCIITQNGHHWPSPWPQSLVRRFYASFS